MYRYELHCHTSEGSRCARNSGAEMAEFYKRAGYTGVVITDHFFNGNCTVPKDLPWKERVALYCRGYENAKAHGDKIGIDVFFGWEFGGDFVTLGLSPAWLAAHENLDKLTVYEYFETVHKDGGYIIHAHPFRESPYTKLLRMFPREVDAMETINAQNSDFMNGTAEIMAARYGVTPACGSDAHCILEPRLCALLLDARAADLGALIDAMRQRRHAVIQYDVARAGDAVTLTEYVPCE